MNFDLTDVQASWRDKGQALGLELARDAEAAGVVMGAARLGLLDPQADPFELKNLADDPGLKDVKAELSALVKNYTSGKGSR